MRAARLIAATQPLPSTLPHPALQASSAADEDARIQALLVQARIAPTAQRMAVARLLLARPTHMTAEQVCTCLREQGQAVSRATVYGTLQLFTRRGLLHELVIEGESAVFDSNTQPHHHFYDVETHAVTDIAADALQISGMAQLARHWQIEHVDVVLRGRRKATPG